MVRETALWRRGWGARAICFVGFWCFGAYVAARAKRRVVRGRTGASCESGGRPRNAYFPRFFSMRFVRFIMLGDCWGQKHGFRPRCTGGGPERSPKREMPDLASQALATDPFTRFFQLRHARKPRLADPACSSAATQISPTRLKPPKNGGFRRQFAAARFLAKPIITPSCDPRPKASFAPKGWLRNAAAHACGFATQGHFWP